MLQETLHNSSLFVTPPISACGHKGIPPSYPKPTDHEPPRVMQSQRHPWAHWVAVSLAFGCTAGAWAAPATAVASEPAQVIVKFKEQARVLRPQVLAFQRPQAQATALGERAGLKLKGGSEVADRTHVVTALGMSSQALADQLTLDANVEYAVPNQRRHAHAIPNDPRYANDFTGDKGPTSGQWYLRAPQGDVQSAINAQAAWDLTQNNTSVVVAVLDTGIRFDHPELKPVAQGGNVLPGYDMVTDTGIANDDNERDSDAQDPGDWVSEQDISPGGSLEGKGCLLENSTWHGTQTAALVGALANNGIGMTGVGRNVQVLPVRVLGKCGGMDSDIIAGMRWAAGLKVEGVPDNPNPARIINLSLGGAGVCTKPYIEVLQEIAAAGGLVVISAGNDAGGEVTAPANCPGALAVAGLQHTGAKVGFSDLGPEVAISAPAGNCVNISGGPCVYPILTATNAGKTTPILDDDSYTDSENYSAGTSFSAPLVAGTAALMLSVKPDLTPAQLRQLLMTSAKPFPTTGALSDVPSAQVKKCTPAQTNFSGGITPQLQCYCTTETCGAGMLDAAAAMRAVLSIDPSNQPSSASSPAISKGFATGGGAVGGAWLLGLFAGTVVLVMLRWQSKLKVSRRP
jgi:serine protease